VGDALYSHAVQVRWRDTDALGHVNHAVMLTYLEEGRDAFLTSRLGTLPMYVIVRMELEFFGELRLDRRTVIAQTDEIKLGRTSFTLYERLVADGSDLARALVVCVRWNAEAREPLALSSHERSALEHAGRVTKDQNARPGDVPRR
jgi:acyl-CoA thioester hydrolase